jgi:hypothetical protein
VNRILALFRSPRLWGCILFVGLTARSSAQDLAALAKPWSPPFQAEDVYWTTPTKLHVSNAAPVRRILS